MKRFIGLAVSVALVASYANIAAAAEDEGPNFSLGASTSYTFDINDPDPENQQPANVALYGSQEQDESFNIDLVQIGANGQRGAVTYGAKVDFGDLASWAGDDEEGDVGLQEAYLAIDTCGLKVTAGRFGKLIGYEVLEPWGNANISRSNAWQLQPINHDGLSVSANMSGVDMTVGVVNGFTVWDPAGNNIDDEYGVIWGLGGSVGGADLWFAGIYSEEADTVDVLELNGIVSGDLGGVTGGLEGTYLDLDSDGEDVDGKIWDITGYLGVNQGPWGLDLRASWTNEDLDYGYITDDSSDENDVWSITATGSYEIVENVSARLEYRHDEADLCQYGDDSSSDPTTDSIDVVQAQLVWAR